MNANAVAKHYASLTPEERWRLMFAAGGRGDEAERERLLRVGQRLNLPMLDHQPYAHAFQDLEQLTYMDLVETAALYFDAFAHVRNAACRDQATDMDDEEGESDGDEASDVSEAQTTEEDSDEDLAWGLALANGYLLKTKAEGWKLFCERLNVPPFLCWSHYPGYHRLQRALAFVAGTDSFPGPAFVAEGMVRFFNRIRAAGKPEVTADGLMTAEKIADELEESYRQRSKWWGG